MFFWCPRRDESCAAVYVRAAQLLPWRDGCTSEGVGAATEECGDLDMSATGRSKGAPCSAVLQVGQIARPFGLYLLQDFQAFFEPAPR